MKRKTLSNRRGHITQKVRIGNIRTLYLSIDDEPPNEIFLRIRGQADAEKVVGYDVIARLISMALQHGITVATIAERLHGTRSEPAGPVVGDDEVKFCDGTMDYIGRHLLIRFAGRTDLAHVTKEPSCE